MKRLILLLSLLNFIVAQDLSGVRICVDPGHGGHESDDREIVATGFWESESNLTKGLELRDILLGLGADVAITRTGNYDPPPSPAGESTPDDPTLSERVGMANAFNADFFNSTHSNGFNGTANYAMVIFNGTTSSPTFPGARTMANIMAPKIHAVNHTTQSISIGDLTLNPSWTYGYGVLYPANMPATISEGSFHDYIPESWRLMNLEYRKHEARAQARSILQYFSEPGFATGAVAGLVRDPEHTVSYYAMNSLQDQYQPVNDLQVTVEPGGYIYHGDENNNGYFKIDSLDPGQYEIIVAAPGFTSDTTTFSVSANQTRMINFTLLDIAPPMIIASEPTASDSNYAAWEALTFHFSKPMVADSLEAAITLTPEAPGTLSLTNGGLTAIYQPDDTLDYLSDYEITIAASAVDVYGRPLDGNQDGVGGDDWTLSFRTGPRDMIPPAITYHWPQDGDNEVAQRPVFTIEWSELLDETSIDAEMIKLERRSNLQLQVTTLEHHVIDDRSVLVLYADNDLLPYEAYRVRVFPGFEDLVGNAFTAGLVINFNTANYEYDVTFIDNFDNNPLGSWWDITSSGSNLGYLDPESYTSVNTDVVIHTENSEQSLQLNYGWDTSDGEWLLRQYLSTGAPLNVTFTSADIMQAFVFGDGNGNQFRFCVDDASGTEVSPWYSIDWTGWRLVTWDMSVDGTGTWIGDGTLNGNLKFDSMQLTHVVGQPNIGHYIVDDLRLVSREYLDAVSSPEMPTEMILGTNYPNPFNPVTAVPFSLPEASDVRVSVYDLKGQEVDILFQGHLPAGQHTTRWVASEFPSGLYVIKLAANERSVTRKITLLK